MLTRIRGNRTRKVRLPPRKARDVRILFGAFGEKNVYVDSQGRWFMIMNYHLRSHRYEFSRPVVYLLGFWPRDYGERRGLGAGIEHFYTDKDLRIRRKGAVNSAWCEIPNTWIGMDPAGLQATRKEHMYVCIHLDFDPDRHTVADSLDPVQLMLTDPTALR